MKHFYGQWNVAIIYQGGGRKCKYRMILVYWLHMRVTHLNTSLQGRLNDAYHPTQTVICII